MYVCVFIYIDIINIHSTHTLCEQKLLFWIRLIAINRLTALVFINHKLSHPFYKLISVDLSVAIF